MLPAPQPKRSESIVASHVPQPISAVVPDLLFRLPLPDGVLEIPSTTSISAPLTEASS